MIDLTVGRMFFNATATYPRLCAVSYSTDVWYHIVDGDGDYEIVGIYSNGIMSRGTYADSNQQLRQLVGDAADIWP